MNLQREDFNISTNPADEEASRVARISLEPPASWRWQSSSRQEEVKEPIMPSRSLFPSTSEVESIKIPSYQAVFDKVDAERTERKRVPWGSSSLPSLDPTASDSRESSGHFEYGTEGYDAAPCPKEEYPDPRHDDFSRMDDVNPSSSLSQPGRCRRTIEVSPGLELPLYGAQETTAALHRGEIACTTCLVCPSGRLYCHNQADYVLCPVCFVVSPVTLMEPEHEQARMLLARESSSTDKKIKAHTRSEETEEGGPCRPGVVGLGMTELDYLEYHYEQSHTTTASKPKSS